MLRRLRRDLEWQDAAEDGALLLDRCTGREFALSRAQVVLLRTFAEEHDLSRVASIAAELLDLEIDEDLVAEVLATFEGLALFDEPDLTPELVRSRQREARRDHFEASRLDALGEWLPALRRLPYYARVLPDPLPTIDATAELAGLPVLAKSDLREHFDEFLPADRSGADIRWMSTSGTTGERQQVVRSLADWAAIQPWTWSLNGRVRDVLGRRFCRLTTPFCDGTECHLQRASRAERTHGRRLSLETGIDIASFAPERLASMARELVEHEPAYLLVDPAYLAIFADHALRLRLPLPRVELVLTAYELGSALHRRVIERAFQCPVYDAYGATEFGALAVQCERGLYHINPSSFIVELADSGTRGDAGRMLVTTLDKQVMPLLRYDTGDLARPAAAPCTCTWSETDTLLSLEGRLADVIAAADGARLTPGAIDRAVASAAIGVVAYCLVQRGPASYRVDYLAGEDFEARSVDRVLESLHAELGPGATIRAERRRELLPAPSGKFRLSYAEPRALGRPS